MSQNAKVNLTLIKLHSLHVGVMAPFESMVLFVVSKLVCK